MTYCETLENLEYNRERVLTTPQLAKVYGTTPKKISNNFSRNKYRYTIGVHYYILMGHEKLDFLNRHQKEDGLKHAENLYLWTAKGAMLHAKSLKTDAAWAIGERLVDSYFRMGELVKTLSENKKLLEQQRLEAPFTAAGHTLLDHSTISTSFKDYCKLYNLMYDGKILGRNRFMRLLRQHGFLCKNNTPTQKAKDLGVLIPYREIRINKQGRAYIVYSTHVTAKGEAFFQRWLSSIDSTVS